MFSYIYCITPPHRRPPGVNPKPNQSLIPMKSVHFLALVENAIVNLSVTQQFINEDSRPLEVFYSFAVFEDSVVSSLKIHLKDGSILTAKVEDAEKASETYQDALASGNTAVMGKVEEDNKTLTANIGNLGPGDSVKVEFGLSFPLEAHFDYWKLEIPKTFLPVNDRDVVFSVSVVVHSSEKIKKFSSSFETEWVLSEDKLVLQGDTRIKPLSDFPSKNIWFKYQAEDSNKPKLIYQKYKNKYYGMIAFVPFDQSLKSLDDAEGQGEYIFLLDRSASMDGIRINIAKQAIVLFLKSLPEDSYFNIVSFGSYYKKMHPDSVKSSSSNIDWSIEQVQTFSADMGGTKIYSPLEDILRGPLIEGYSKTIFLITDGEVERPESVIDLISQNSGKSRIHSFGIGNSFDKNLIQKSAKAGRGTANFVNDLGEMGGKVIGALQRSLVPCVSQMKIGMAGELYPRPEKLGNVYYGERYLQYFETDEISENPILFSYHDDFRKKNEEILIGNLKMIEGDFLFKLWAKYRIENLYENVNENKNEIKKLSIEAGVPCGLTSFICVKENDEAVIEELNSVEVKTQTDPLNNIRMPAGPLVMPVGPPVIKPMTPIIKPMAPGISACPLGLSMSVTPLGILPTASSIQKVPAPSITFFKAAGISCKPPPKQSDSQKLGFQKVDSQGMLSFFDAKPVKAENFNFGSQNRDKVSNSYSAMPNIPKSNQDKSAMPFFSKTNQDKSAMPFYSKSNQDKSEIKSSLNSSFFGSKNFLPQTQATHTLEGPPKLADPPSKKSFFFSDTQTSKTCSTSSLMSGPQPSSAQPLTKNSFFSGSSTSNTCSTSSLMPGPQPSSVQPLTKNSFFSGTQTSKTFSTSSLMSVPQPLSAQPMKKDSFFSGMPTSKTCSTSSPMSGPKPSSDPILSSPPLSVSPLSVPLPLSGPPSLSGPPVQSTNNIPKTLDYMNIISSQSSKGLWDYDAFVLLIPGISQIPQDHLNCSDRNNAICTILVLLLLERNYKEKQNEWVLVMRKAVRWLKTLDIEYQEIKESFQRFI